MVMKCELTGKMFKVVIMLAMLKIVQKEVFYQILQNISFLSEKLGRKIQLKVATSTIRTVEKQGGLR